MGFDEVLPELRRGHTAYREGWNGKDQWIGLQVPDENSKMRRPYLYISPVDGELVPWAASQTDVLAEDWVIVIDE